MAASLGKVRSGAHPGVWVNFIESDNGEVGKLLVRPLLPAEEQRLQVVTQGARVTIRSADGETAQDLNSTAIAKLVRARAALSWLDAQGVSITVSDAGAAQAYAAFTGRQIQEGDAILLDGLIARRATATVSVISDDGRIVQETREMTLGEYILQGEHGAWITEFINGAAADIAKEERGRQAGKART